MQTTAKTSPDEENYRQILGVRFFTGDAAAAVEAGCQGGLVVAPAAPALVELGRDHEYRDALLESDVVITDSGFMVLLWNLMKRDHIHRVSGLEYLRLLMNRPEFKERGSVLWVMPSAGSVELNLRWLRAGGLVADADACYVAPKYPRGAINDEQLVKLISERRPRHVIIGLGGGVQEKLGAYLKRHCGAKVAIHCVGAAVGFLTGDQVHIPEWADKSILGWLFRCISDPKRFVPRYFRALRLPMLLLRYGTKSPDSGS